MSEQTADQVCWELPPAPWPSSDSLLALVVELLPMIEDEVEADLVQRLGLALVERDEQVAAMRLVLSVALAALNDSHREKDRLP